ncbi:YihD family protein [Vibrio sp. SS-MA-C1-2]|uniref:YihD family protein n=1 Tax=Vibrio sp. SS-MA-C1-2 TaxID=2908646 RepID=UPI001F177A4E|nr:YihD family protein [Vibrio sp. SS-MA-C1-2]UJF19351.1 YihD family protein [Vibrio sp. SS-MA-C1-2]
MKCHRVNELIELIHPEWQKDSDLNLIQFLVKLAEEAKYEGPLEELTDDVLIYHLKMRNSQKDEMIPGLAKDQEDDFKTAILKARGIITE